VHRRSELPQRALLDLPDALVAEAELVADLAQRPFFVVLEAVAGAQDVPLAFGETREQTVQLV